jgi:hypothetical protein
MIKAAEISRRAWRKWKRLHKHEGLELVPLGPCGRSDPKLRVTKEWAKELATLAEDSPAAANLTGILFWYLTEHDKGDTHPRHPSRCPDNDEPYMEDEDDQDED